MAEYGQKTAEDEEVEEKIAVVIPRLPTNRFIFGDPSLPVQNLPKSKVVLDVEKMNRAALDQETWVLPASENLTYDPGFKVNTSVEMFTSFWENQDKFQDIPDLRSFKTKLPPRTKNMEEIARLLQSPVPMEITRPVEHELVTSGSRLSEVYNYVLGRAIGKTFIHQCDERTFTLFDKLNQQLCLEISLSVGENESVHVWPDSRRSKYYNFVYGFEHNVKYDTIFIGYDLVSTCSDSTRLRSLLKMISESLSDIGKAYFYKPIFKDDNNKSSISTIFRTVYVKGEYQRVVAMGGSGLFNGNYDIPHNDIEHTAKECGMDYYTASPSSLTFAGRLGLNNTITIGWFQKRNEIDEQCLDFQVYPEPIIFGSVLDSITNDYDNHANGTYFGQADLKMFDTGRLLIGAKIDGLNFALWSDGEGNSYIIERGTRRVFQLTTIMDGLRRGYWNCELLQSSVVFDPGKKFGLLCFDSKANGPYSYRMRIAAEELHPHGILINKYYYLDAITTKEALMSIWDQPQVDGLVLIDGGTTRNSGGEKRFGVNPARYIKKVPTADIRRDEVDWSKYSNLEMQMDGCDVYEVDSTGRVLKPRPDKPIDQLIYKEEFSSYFQNNVGVETLWQYISSRQAKLAIHHEPYEVARLGATSLIDLIGNMDKLNILAATYPAPLSWEGHDEYMPVLYTLRWVKFYSRPMNLDTFSNDLNNITRAITLEMPVYKKRKG